MTYAAGFGLLAATLPFNPWVVDSWWGSGLLAWSGIALALRAAGIHWLCGLDHRQNDQKAG